MKLLAFERKNVHAILEAFAPHTATEGLVPQDGEVDYVEAYEIIADSSTDRARIGVRAALWLAMLAPMWMGIAFCTMASLPIMERSRIIERMLASNTFIVREFTLLLKIGAAFALMGSRSVRARSNYDRHAVKRPSDPIILRVQRERPQVSLPLVARTSTPGVV